MHLIGQDSIVLRITYVTPWYSGYTRAKHTHRCRCLCFQKHQWTAWAWLKQLCIVFETTPGYSSELTAGTWIWLLWSCVKERKSQQMSDCVYCMCMHCHTYVYACVRIHSYNYVSCDQENLRILHRNYHLSSNNHQDQTKTRKRKRDGCRWVA